MDFFLSQQSKNIDLEQKVFITECFSNNTLINGAEIRKKYKDQYPNRENMFGKKVQNMLQILRKGKDIIKNKQDYKRHKTEDGLFQSTNTSSLMQSVSSEIYKHPGS